MTGLGIVLQYLFSGVYVCVFGGSGWCAVDKELMRYLVRLLLSGVIVGFDNQVVDGKVKVYVRSAGDVILYNLASEFEGVSLEYVEVGDVRFLSSDVPNRGKFRPVRPGVSVGLPGWGTGTLTGVFRDSYGRVFLASNAHVFTKDPTLCPYEVKDRDVIQPGVHDGGGLGDVVARYSWHQPVVTLGKPVSCCRVSRLVAGVLSWLSGVLGRRTRFVPTQVPVNFIDFAVASPLVEFDVVPVGLDLSEYNIVGVGFAGSDIVSVVVNVYNILKVGFEPVGFKPVPVKAGMAVVKTGRTTGVTRGVVLSPSSVVSVNLGGDVAVFVDVILTSRMLEPGDSGSPVFAL